MITVKRFQQLLIIICALIGVAMTLAAQNRKTAGHPNFTGTWRLNRQLSDNPQEKMKEAIGSVGGMTGALGRVMGGKRGGRGKADERTKNNQLMAGSLRIIHNDPEFQLMADNETGASKTFFTDGRPVSNTRQIRGKEVDTQTTARWQGEQLVVTTQTENGGKRIVTYQLAPSGNQMTLLAKITNPKLERPIEIRLVYDAEGGQ